MVHRAHEAEEGSPAGFFVAIFSIPSR